MADRRNVTTHANPRRRRLHDLLRKVIACVEEAAAAEDDPHTTAVNVFIATVNEMQQMGRDRDMFSSALIAAAGAFAHFAATSAYRQPLEDEDIQFVQELVAECMASCAARARAIKRLN